MAGAHLTRRTSQGVALLGDESCPGGVTFAFTEREGGASEGPYASLNLGDACGDDPLHVSENRRRALAALGAEEHFARLINPKQVHGSHVVRVTDASDAALERARTEARSGADAIVCIVPDVPVLLCFADCVPIVLCAPGAFAVVHSGWRGTIAKIARVACEALCEEASVDPSQVSAYVGPHILGADYEVSSELCERFAHAFGPEVVLEGSRLDLLAAVTSTLVEAGIAQECIAACGVSTARATDRFFSYRASGGTCGRHGALAYIRSSFEKEV